MRTIFALSTLLAILIAAPAASAFEDWDEPMEVPFKDGDQVTKVRIKPAVMARALKAMGFETFGQIASSDAETLKSKYDAGKGLDLDATLTLDEKFEIKFWNSAIKAAKTMDADQAITPAATARCLQKQQQVLQTLSNVSK